MLQLQLSLFIDNALSDTAPSAQQPALGIPNSNYYPPPPAASAAVWAGAAGKDKETKPG